ncbi:phosphoglycolate phosphatase [Tistlia consotensis]|uniref:phosphoglycolate phosphatase n=1 Tax=Tistlia consotensis USBA 355 TaxID=560819 RepID=A0A1Y6CQ59_9PROT|nr:HAD-IA family hydrolase [Tistlia consotensis]SMF67329.1 phosphoglycolate phosphatase [Tistlia consotensis USBA 355]SNR99988.1 phosphoglycolate phosphatase [Tistlia consotensis]
MSDLSPRRPAGRDVLLVDLDGTLVDSAPDLARALNALLVEQAVEPLPLPTVKSMVGEGARKLVERAAAARGLTASLDALVERFLALYAETLTVETLPFPGAVETLQGLKAEGWRLALCTNKPIGFSRTILEALDLGRLFEAAAGGDSFPMRKPDPRHLALTLEPLGLGLERAVMLGDGPSDLEAAAAAGIPSVWCRFGYGGARAAGLPRTAEIGGFGELPGVLSRL